MLTTRCSPPTSRSARDGDRDMNLIKLCLICLAQCLLAVLEYITKVGGGAGGWL